MCVRLAAWTLTSVTLFGALSARKVLRLKFSVFPLSALERLSSAVPGGPTSWFYTASHHLREHLE